MSKSLGQQKGIDKSQIKGVKGSSRGSCATSIGPLCRQLYTCRHYTKAYYTEKSAPLYTNSDLFKSK